LDYKNNKLQRRIKMIQIKQLLLTNPNRPKKKLLKMKGVVMHYTASYGKGADALAIRNYFNTTNRACSAHYAVDDHQIVQCIPDNEVAWHVGNKIYTAIGEKLRDKPYSPNYYLIGIEMCVNCDGDWNKTYANSVDLAAALLKKNKLGIGSLYRHYDITGKICPKMMIAEKDWLKFKAAVAAKLKQSI
jgi:N-acetylmuramoyl-L-alanine amidase